MERAIVGDWTVATVKMYKRNKMWIMNEMNDKPNACMMDVYWKRGCQRANPRDSRCSTLTDERAVCYHSNSLEIEIIKISLSENTELKGESQTYPLHFEKR
jgi:hypothetical protein